MQLRLCLATTQITVFTWSELKGISIAEEEALVSSMHLTENNEEAQNKYKKSAHGRHTNLISPENTERRQA
jgi:hypothetical protein